MTIASMSSARWRRYEKSGSTRSIPSMSAVGNRSPVSTTTIRSSYSTTVMFLPISPSPPRGRTRKFPLTSTPPQPEFAAGQTPQRRRSLRRSRGGGQHAVALEHGAHDRELGLVELHVGQTGLAHRDADEVQRRLVAARGRDDGHVPVDIVEAGIDLPAVLRLVDHPAHLLAEDVAAGE